MVGLPALDLVYGDHQKSLQQSLFGEVNNRYTLVPVNEVRNEVQNGTLCKH